MDSVTALEASDLAAEIAGEIERARSDARHDPFGNPVLRVSLWLTRRIDRGEVAIGDVTQAIETIGRAAVGDRADRLARYVELPSGRAGYAALAERLAVDAAGDFDAYAAAVARPAFVAVFTAHPTFAMNRRLADAMARLASGDPAGRETLDAPGLSFRPDAPITLQDEFEQARDGVRRARAALDGLNAAFLDAARTRWPDRWTELAPCPIALASWVGCDTDGRTDIGWWDTVRYRLESKRTAFGRMLDRLPPTASEVRNLVSGALACVEDQLAKAPPLKSEPPMAALRDFALAVVEGRDLALPDAARLIAALDRAMAAASTDEDRIAIGLVRAGCVAHGVSVALPHFRLNATQLHNAVRGAILIEGDPTQPTHRRAFLAAANDALADVEAVPVEFGALAAERASAARMLMTIAQILKHVDGSKPVRFLIAETETGYTLLSALWLARRYGIADKLEISPLFETSEALEEGPRIVDEALRNPHWRDYLRAHGRFAIQFGYSDSGRYIGQVASTFWVERIRLQISQLMVRYGLADIELVLFDTHGESIGRGAHPGSMRDRLLYLAPPRARAVFAEAGIRVVRETSFQGSDGYLLFGTEALAEATVARIAESVFETPADDADPIYDDPDFATGFFQTVRAEMRALVDDPGYAATIGTFGPALLDKTGSRPAARQSDAGGPARITHPRELRAIPNNAILQQLGWMANSFHGFGRAAGQAPDTFVAMRERSDRFGRAWRLAEAAIARSDLDVVRAYLDTLDPGTWIDRARRTERDERRAELLPIASALARMDLAPALRRMFARLAADRIELREAAGDLPAMPTRLLALHAMRLAVIHRIWFLSTHVPDFRPQTGTSRDGMMDRIIRLDVPGALALLGEIFPLGPSPADEMDFGEPRAPRETGTYEALHRDVLEPMAAWFGLLREISGAAQHDVGAFG